MMCNNVEKDLANVLHETAAKLNLKDYDFDLSDLSAKRGDGYMGEMYKVSIITKDGKKTKFDLVIKKAPLSEIKRKGSDIAEAYLNEIHFYTVIFPVLDKFQRDCQVARPLKTIATYFASISENARETIVLEDITSLGFRMKDACVPFDDQHATLIFRNYGRFHALSYALKKKYPGKVQELMTPIVDYLKLLLSKPGFHNTITKLTNKSINALDPVEDKLIAEKCKSYEDNGFDILTNISEYDGEYSVIQHGDCWSNNMMFKYVGEEVDEMKFLDFQMVRIGSPIHDLAYFVFTGGSKELYDNVERYLDVYHESFTNFAKELGCETKDLIPRHVLSDLWKKYAKFGVLMSFMHVKSRLIRKEDMVKLAEDFGTKQGSDRFVNFHCDEEEYNRIVRQMLVHLHENDAL